MPTRAVYHGTFHKHAQGCPQARRGSGPFGLHFGTLTAAGQRLAHIRQNRPLRGTGYIYEAEIDPKKMLTGVKDAGLWNSPRDVAFVLSKKLGRGDNDSSVFGKAWHNFPYVGASSALSALRRLAKHLRALGYDAISYKNAFEDKGKTSYIVLDPSIVKRCRLYATEVK